MTTNENSYARAPLTEAHVADAQVMTHRERVLAEHAAPTAYNFARRLSRAAKKLATNWCLPRGES